MPSKYLGTNRYTAMRHLEIQIVLFQFPHLMIIIAGAIIAGCKVPK